MSSRAFAQSVRRLRGWGQGCRAALEELPGSARFTWVEGVGIHIRRIPMAQIKLGALVDGAVIFSADMGHQIDNMEGLAVPQSSGATVLTLVSDDNFSAIQRTLLQQFRLVE